MSAKLVPAICTQCGGTVEVDPTQEKAFCKYCGTSFFVEKAIKNYNIQHANIERVEFMNVHKHSAVESILTFIEKQQDKKQKRIDEEKRRLEEEKRKREEQRKEIMNQIFNEKYRKRNLIIVGFVAILILVMGIMLATSEKPSHEGEAKTPGGSSYHQGRNYKDVVTDFEDSGFINVKTRKLEDLITGWLTKDGEVESVSVDGDVDYMADVWYPNDVEVIITYHTFPEKEIDDIPEDENDGSIEETTASIYEKGYRVRFTTYDIYYLIDEDAKTISIFDTTEEYTDIYVSEYSGDFNNGIEFDWGGLKMSAHYKYIDQDDTLIIRDESGAEMEATKVPVDIVESYIKTR